MMIKSMVIKDGKLFNAVFDTFAFIINMCLTISVDFLSCTLYNGHYLNRRPPAAMRPIIPAPLAMLNDSPRRQKTPPLSASAETLADVLAVLVEPQLPNTIPAGIGF